MQLKNSASAILLALATVSVAAQADPIIYESFTGYADNALISVGPAGPATGLAGDWSLDAENFFYVNQTEADPTAGTGKAVYDMPWDDNGARTAQRFTSGDHALFSTDGDVFYASFLIHPPRSTGGMLFALILEQRNGGGQPDLSFGINDGHFVIGNGGVNVDIVGGIPSDTQMRLVLRIEYGDAGSGPDDLEVVTLWVDPVDESSGPVIDEVPVDLLNRGGASVTGVAIRGEQMAGQAAFFDDLLVGFEFQDVNETPPDGALSNDLGVNGLFYDPNNSGHGFDFVASAQGLTVYYYGHSAMGERIWLVSGNHEGDLEFNMPFELEMYEVAAGEFGQPQLPATTWGTITISLADCNTGQASFSGLDGALEMDIVRLTAMPGTACQ